jgi:FixJ family two-component response regulator
LNARSRIAVVDDHDAVRKALKRLLVAAGMEAETFASGQDFLDALVPNPFHCVLLDLHMPGLTGLDVLKELQERRIRLPAIVITAHDDPAARAQCLAWGARAYLLKPLDDQPLLAAIADAVRRR